MFDGLFGWLRRSCRAAVIGGVQDAIADLTTATEGDDVPKLQLIFRPKQEAKKGRKEA